MARAGGLVQVSGIAAYTMGKPTANKDKINAPRFESVVGREGGWSFRWVAMGVGGHKVVLQDKRQVCWGLPFA